MSGPTVNKLILSNLEEVWEYFDNRADADCDQDGFIPNEEMRLLSLVAETTKLLEREAEIRAAILAAVRNLNAHIEHMQGIMTKHIQPFGYDESEVINRLLYALDGPDQRLVQEEARAAIAAAEPKP